MNYVIPPAPLPAIAVNGSDDLFPVRRIYCVGRNYAAHAREMGSDPTREPPFFFCKPADAAVPIAVDGRTRLPYPPATTNFHHEIELVVAIGKAGRAIAAKDALEHVWGYALGLDMTRRDLQFALRDKGRPWELGKAFDQSAPISPLYRAAHVGHLRSGRIWLKVNGQIKQESDIADLIWPVAETIAYLSNYVELMPGDLIFTGTPEGVSPVLPGDTLEGGLDGLCQIALHVGQPI